MNRTNVIKCSLWIINLTIVNHINKQIDYKKNQLNALEIFHMRRNMPRL